jgi:CheY-like chemotaxis protein
LESRGFEVLTAQSGDEALYAYKKHGLFAFVLCDYRFFPGTKIGDGVQLVTAIHAIKPRQQMAIMTASSEEARGKAPQFLRHLPILRKPYRVEQLLRLLREPVLPLN